MKTAAFNLAFDGVLKILRFNRGLYVATAIGCVIGIFVTAALPWTPVRWFALAGIGLALFWLVASLIVSHWVYDRSVLYKWDWIRERMAAMPLHWLHIHAGLDESSEAIEKLFPNATGHVWDIFDGNEMTEPSILEARKHENVARPPVDFRNLPAEDGSFDTIFLIFAAHEIRRHQSRLRFFHELFRVCKTGARVLIVEHVRDWKNFVAYGPGFLHFQTYGEWIRLAAESGFRIEHQSTITPFVHVFVLRKDV